MNSSVIASSEPQRTFSRKVGQRQCCETSGASSPQCTGAGLVGSLRNEAQCMFIGRSRTAGEQRLLALTLKSLRRRSTKFGASSNSESEWEQVAIDVDNYCRRRASSGRCSSYLVVPSLLPMSRETALPNCQRPWFSLERVRPMDLHFASRVGTFAQRFGTQLARRVARSISSCATQGCSTDTP